MANPRLLWLSLRSAFLLFCLHLVHSDVYMHNPRGSNDRLNGGGPNRQNANRLFDSQNNAKGGYNVGEFPNRNGAHSQDLQYAMKYFMSGSKHKSSTDKHGKSHLVIEWTNQHGCGHSDLDCNIVLQYMCQEQQYESLDDRKNNNYDTIRNGKTENTILYNKVAISRRIDKNIRKRSNARIEYGMHEPWEWHDKCTRRERNKGLFAADQQLKDDRGSTSTRQNPNGNRHGYECPEERDYYPYWHPTDWKDIAVYATNQKQCDSYNYFSFNRHPKGECLDPYPNNDGFKHYSEANNPETCKARGGLWVLFHSFMEVKPEYKDKTSCEKASTEDVPLVWGVPYRSEIVDALKIDPVSKEPKRSCLVQPSKVDCRISPLSRPNHLGNVEDSQAMNYTWILPYFPSQTQKRCALRIRYNISTMDYDSNRTFSDKNGAGNSPVTNDPDVVLQTKRIPITLQLAVNTAQFGRTFQDRSHVFYLYPRQGNGNSIADDIAAYNINVRGKRGNIVQVYPAVEYDFVPKHLTVASDDFINFQWTGSTRNPGNNDGEGQAGTDKNNLVEIDESGVNVKIKEDGTMISNAKLMWTPDKNVKSMDDVKVALASSGFDFYKGKYGTRLGVSENSRENFQDQLNNSPASYSVALSFAPGEYKYMCTRNNNFSNRNQKASLTVIASTGTSQPKRAGSNSRAASPNSRAASSNSRATTRPTTATTTRPTTRKSTAAATTRPTTPTTPATTTTRPVPKVPARRRRARRRRRVGRRTRRARRTRRRRRRG